MRTLLAFAASLAFALVSNAQQALAPVEPAERDAVVEAAIRVLEASYVFPEVAARMAEELRARARAGEYATTDALELGRAITRDLQAVSRDKHLRVYPGGSQSRPAPRPVPGEHGLGKREILPGNIAYLEVLSFMGRGAAADEAIAEAMTALAGADALIVDVRANGGGSPATVASLSSYLFERPTHLNSLHWREGGRIEEFWTRAQVPGRRFGETKPVFVLTGPRTFSGAEEFAYNLKNLKRAAIVGERTGGGAHPGAVRMLNERFAMFVPTGRAVSPVTGTNWEGTGVEPDVAVPTDQALERAVQLAREALDPGSSSRQRHPG